MSLHTESHLCPEALLSKPFWLIGFEEAWVVRAAGEKCAPDAGQIAQRLQNQSIQEYTVNHIRIPNVIQGIFLP